MTDANDSGEHPSPSDDGAVVLDAAAPPIRPRRRVWMILGAMLLVAGLATSAQLWANRSYDQAFGAYSAAATALATARHSLMQEITALRTATSVAALIHDGDNGLLTTGDARDALRAAVDTSESVGVEVEPTASATPPPEPEKPVAGWALIREANALNRDTERIRSQDDLIEREQGRVHDTSETLNHAVETLLDLAAASVPDFEAAHISARNPHVIELRLAREDLAVAAVGDSGLLAAFERLVGAASAVAESHEEEMAKKAGPLLSSRLTVEEFARSLAGGVLLDFEWETIVNGRGADGSAGGLANWNSAHGGYSTITLSHSVAQRWPSEVMQALVAHEVGHAISAKCYEMFDWQDHDAGEEWATAWAISQGHTADGNGVSLYGYPREEIIEKARSCR